MSNLAAHSKNVHSQHGEDGIIAALFEVIGERNRWCVELGALNGTHDSNTLMLMQKGWSGVLIEADRTYFEKLQSLYASNPRAHCINEFISFEGPSSLDTVLARTSLPKDFDIFSLDIDGNEYHVWDSLKTYRPCVVVVEFNPTIPNEVDFVQPRDMRVFQGSSLRALVRLATSKGYALVATNLTNAFFVLDELYPKFNMSDNAIDVLRTDHSLETKLFQLYDGTLCIAGNTKLVWPQRAIDVDKLQVLPRRARKYPAKIPADASTRWLKYMVRKLPVYPALLRIKRWLVG